MKSAAVPTVFIIDDDRGMRQAIHDLVESVGLRSANNRPRISLGTVDIS